MSDQTTGNDLVAKVRKWLVAEGYPLEYETAREMARVGYRTFQGMFYDDTNGQRREIDVRALEPGTDDPPWGNPCFVVVECKHNTNPWLVLTRAIALPDGAGWFELVKTRVSPMATGQPFAEAAFLLDVPVRHGMNVVEVFNRDANRAYKALRSVVSAARGLLAKQGPHPEVAIPLIVLGGPLLQLGYDDDGAELLEPVSWQRVLWSGAGDNPPHALIDIVTRSELPAYLAKLRPATTALADYLTTLAPHGDGVVDAGQSEA